MRKEIGEDRNLFLAFSEGRNVYRDHIDAIEEVLPETILRYGFFEIAIRGKDQPDINLHWTSFADRMHFALLEKAKKFCLHVEGNLADFIEKERSSMSSSYDPLKIIRRARKGTFSMTE